MIDHNLCEHCEEFHEVGDRACGSCRQPLVADATGAIACWRLGDLEDGVLGPILAGVRKSFGRDVVLQPSFLREDLSDREGRGWQGSSAGVFLNQLSARQAARPRTFLSLGITEKNIVSS